MAFCLRLLRFFVAIRRSEKVLSCTVDITLSIYFQASCNKQVKFMNWYLELRLEKHGGTEVIEFHSGYFTASLLALHGNYTN